MAVIHNTAATSSLPLALSESALIYDCTSVASAATVVLVPDIVA
jgi:hypothetical protein